MNYLFILFVIGWVIRVEALFMLLPFVVGLIYKEDCAIIFLQCSLLFQVIGYGLTRIKPKRHNFYSRESFVIVSLSWIIMSLIGALPLYISGEIPKLVDAMFEIVSGFTTTGASIITDLTVISKSILFWRSFTHWLGGMGVIVFVLIIMPMAGGYGINLIKAESTGPEVGKIVPQMKMAAFNLYAIYFSMTLIYGVLLLLGGMPVFDAACLMFGTAGTGGFAVRPDSCASYSVYLQVITTIFMVLFGINFNFYFLLIKKRFKDALSMEEVRWFLVVYIIASLLIALDLFKDNVNLGESLNLASFQVSTIMSTTGYATTDFNQWSAFSKGILLLVMFIGSCAGSTAGGIKVSRFIIYVKAAVKELAFLIHPRSVKILKLDGKKIEHETVRSVNVFLFCYIVIFVCSFFVISWDNLDFETNFSAVAATLNNIGPGLGMVGPTESFALYSDTAKFVFIFDMLAGRLELFPMILLFTPAMWRKRG